MGPFKKEFGESDDEMEVPEHSTKPADFDLLFAGDIDDHWHKINEVSVLYN
jgi:U3 small nucleolar RNA-associated protein 25